MLNILLEQLPGALSAHDVCAPATSTVGVAVLADARRDRWHGASPAGFQAELTVQAKCARPAELTVLAELARPAELPVLAELARPEVSVAGATMAAPMAPAVPATQTARFAELASPGTETRGYVSANAGASQNNPTGKPIGRGVPPRGRPV